MLFISQPQSYFAQAPSMVSMPMTCSIDDYVEQLQIQRQRELQRERQRAYLQQEYERKVIAKLNEPTVEKFQDEKNYYIVLNKRVNHQTYQYINKFSNYYELKQMDDQFIVRSLVDNYYKTFNLPSNSDLEKDITYQVLNDGYQLKATIPKKVKQRTLPVIQYVICPSTELLSNASPSNLNNCCLANKEISTTPCVSLSPSAKQANDSNSNVEQGIQSIQEAYTGARSKKHSGKTKKANTKGKREQRRNSKSATFVYHTNSDADEGRFRHNNNNTSDESEVKEVKTQTQSKRKLGVSSVNYETTKRRTTFAPNELGFEDEETHSTDNESIPSADDSDFEATVSHPVKKVRSPTVEDLIDEEFA